MEEWCSACDWQALRGPLRGLFFFPRVSCASTLNACGALHPWQQNCRPVGAFADDGQRGWFVDGEAERGWMVQVCRRCPGGLRVCAGWNPRPEGRGYPLAPLPGPLWQGARFSGEEGAEVFEVAPSALDSGVFGDLGFSLPLVASPQARVCGCAVGARVGSAMAVLVAVRWRSW